VFLQQPEPTPADLRFRLFGIDVRVHPFFWLMAAILGWDYLGVGFAHLAIWIVCVFVSILIHEMGHVFMGRLFGTDGHIVLHGFGGLAIGSNELSNPWKRMAVSFAGPLVQLILCGVLWQFGKQARPLSPMLEFALNRMIIINLIWPIFNLLPVIPLDGGQIMRDFLMWISPRRGLQAGLVLSATIAGILALNALSGAHKGPTIPYIPPLGTISAFFFGFMAVANIQALNQVHDRNRWIDSHRYDYEDERDGWRGGR
jgi:stage IV sporulation protein FB